MNLDLKNDSHQGDVKGIRQVCQLMEMCDDQYGIYAGKGV